MCENNIQEVGLKSTLSRKVVFVGMLLLLVVTCILAWDIFNRGPGQVGCVDWVVDIGEDPVADKLIVKFMSCPIQQIGTVFIFVWNEGNTTGCKVHKSQLDTSGFSFVIDQDDVFLVYNDTNMKLATKPKTGGWSFGITYDGFDDTDRITKEVRVKLELESSWLRLITTPSFWEFKNNFWTEQELQVNTRLLSEGNEGRSKLLTITVP